MMVGATSQDEIVGWQLIGIEDGLIMLGGCDGSPDCFYNEVPIYGTVYSYPSIGLVPSMPGTSGGGNGGGGRGGTPATTRFKDCLKGALRQTLSETTNNFGKNLKKSVEYGVPLGLGICGVLIGVEPELAPGALPICALTTWQTVQTGVNFSINIFVISAATDLVAVPAYCAANEF